MATEGGPWAWLLQLNIALLFAPPIVAKSACGAMKDDDHSRVLLSRFYHSNPIFTSASHSETPLRNRQIIENKWRKRVGVEPTGDGIARRPPVLKTGTITGPHALPRCIINLAVLSFSSRRMSH